MFRVVCLEIMFYPKDDNTDKQKVTKRSVAVHRVDDGEEDTHEVNSQDLNDQQEKRHDVDRNPSFSSVQERTNKPEARS